MRPRSVLTVSLTPELQTFIGERVASGRYRSASEVVREALRRLEDAPGPPSPAQALSAREADLGALIDRLPVGIGVTDAQGRTLLLNPAGLRMHGFTSLGEMLVHLEQYRAQFELRYPDGRLIPPDEWPLSRVLRGEEVRDYEVRLRNQTEGVERTVTYSAVPASEGLGGGGRMVFVIHDITDRKRAEEAQRESEARFRLLADSIPALVSSLDRTLVYRFVNRAYSEWFGLPREAMQGRHIREVVGEETYAVIEPKLRAALRGETIDYEATLPYDRGGSRYVLATYTPDVNPAGEVQGVYVMVHDITARRRAEVALAASEREFRTIFELAGAGQAQTDVRTGRFTRVNHKYCEITGYSEAELLRMTPWDLTHPEDREQDAERVRAAIGGTAADWHSEKRYIRKDGAIAWVAVTGSTIRDEAGRPTFTTAIIHDITDRKRSEERVLSVAQFPEQNPSPVLRVQRSGQVLYANRAARELLGEEDANTAVRLPPRLLPEVCRALADGRNRELEVPWPDGRHIAFVLAPIPEEGYVNLYGHDLSDRRRAERELARSKAEFEAIFHSIQDAAIFADPQRHILAVNPAFTRIFGYAAEEVAGRTTDFLFAADEVQPDEAEPAEPHPSLRGEPARRCRRKDGVVFWSETLGTPVRDAAGRRLGLLVIHRDITERKRAEQERNALLNSERRARSEAERAVRVKDEFLATLSHELRTPLSAILGWSQMLWQGLLDEGERPEALQSIHKNARLLKQLIEDLLDMSRISSGKLKLSLTPVDMVAVVRDAVATIRPDATAAGLRVQAQLGAGRGEVLGDEARLKQVLGNLLVNAVKFTPAGGAIRVRVLRTPQSVVIAVRDTGVGIAPEFLPQLFERFRQADASSTRRYRGLGLGLALVKQLTDLHGGTVRAWSRGQGQGATFAVRLPALREGHGAVAQVAGAVELTGTKVLVVDDEPTTLALVVRILKEAGAAVTACTGAAEALSELAVRDFGILISDISMPGEDGYMLLRRLRALPDARRAATPAIALTAFARDEDRHRTCRAGFLTHLAKPVDAAELCATVARLARRNHERLRA